MTVPKKSLAKELRARLAARNQPQLTAENHAIRCPLFWCGRLDNCDECAARRREIDELAERPARSASEIREAVRLSMGGT
jgi:hypothetical protein